MKSLISRPWKAFEAPRPYSRALSALENLPAAYKIGQPAHGILIEVPWERGGPFPYQPSFMITGPNDQKLMVEVTTQGCLVLLNMIKISQIDRHLQKIGCKLLVLAYDDESARARDWQRPEFAHLAVHVVREDDLSILIEHTLASERSSRA